MVVNPPEKTGRGLTEALAPAAHSQVRGRRRPQTQPYCPGLRTLSGRPGGAQQRHIWSRQKSGKSKEGFLEEEGINRVFTWVVLAVPGEEAAPTEKLRSERGLSKLRKLPLSGGQEAGEPGDQPRMPE